MSYATNLDIRAFEAASAIAGNRIVAASGPAGLVAQAAADTDRNVGVAERVGAKAGDMADVITAGQYPVVAGGDLDFNDPVTADAEGRAVKATAGAAGETVYVVGFARAEAAEGDIVNMHVAPSLIVTPAA